MASLLDVFNVDDVPADEGFGEIPPGTYLAQIVQSDMKATRAGTGQMLVLQMEILSGEFTGRRLFDRLNLVNPNPKAVEIANRTLAQICRATGKMTVSDSEELHLIPMLVTVKLKPAGLDRFGVMQEARSEVRGYAPAPQGGMAAAPRPVPRVAAPAGPHPDAAQPVPVSNATADILANLRRRSIQS